MFSRRSLYALAQFLLLQGPDTLLALLAKHGVRGTVPVGAEVRSVANVLEATDDDAVANVVDEIVRTYGALRHNVIPRYRFDERFNDLRRCLELDGYELDECGLRPRDPAVLDTGPVDERLTEEIRAIDLPQGDAIIRKIEASNDHFRGAVPDYNACVADVRISLETLVVEAAGQLAVRQGAAVPARWGQTLSIMVDVSVLTRDEEKALAAVYGFLSHGSHRPLGGTEREHARFARMLGLAMCWFVTQKLRD